MLIEPLTQYIFAIDSACSLHVSTRNVRAALYHFQKHFLYVEYIHIVSLQTFLKWKERA